MGKSNSATTLATESASLLKYKGIYYFKLNPEYFLHRGVGEDEQKTCGLLGTEIDSNFHFLSGFDIKDVEIGDGKLIFHRVNEEFDGTDPLEIDLNDLSGNPTFEYDPETGELKVYYPGEEEPEIVSGFTIDSTFRASTNGTLVGLGNKHSQLGLSPVEKTGEYAPVAEIVDKVKDEDAKPEFENCGYRYISVEHVNKYGALYPYSSVKAIQTALENEESPWRVATEDDWNELLNSEAIEDPEYANHDKSGRRRGLEAGINLKSNEDWVTPGNNLYDFGVLPTGYYSERGLTDAGKTAAFWAYNDDTENPDAIVKMFVENFDGVINDDFSKEDAQWFSVRLVRDYVPGCVNEYEDILGQSIKTGTIDCISKVWTLTNLYMTYDNAPGFEIPNGADEVAYFINEIGNDGKPIRKRMKDGESVVVTGEDYTEYMLKDGELVDAFDKTSEAINSASEALSDKIEELSGVTAEFSGNVAYAILEMSANTVDALGELESEINETNGEIRESISALTESIDNRFADAAAALAEAVEGEKERAEAKETELEESIAEIESGLTEANDRISSANTRIAEVEETLYDIEETLKDVPKYGEYELSQEEVSIPNSGETKEIKIKVSDDFFNFGLVFDDGTIYPQQEEQEEQQH